MQIRKIAVGLVAVVVIVGVYLSGWLPKFGGAGPGSATVATATTKTAPTKAETGEKANSTKKADAAKPKSASKAPPKMPVLDVYVKGHNYQIKDPSGGTELVFIRMEDILKVARLTTGNDEGVRVRILRFRSAKGVSYSQLYSELEKAGLPNSAIRMPHELLEDPKPKDKVVADVPSSRSPDMTRGTHPNE